MVFIGHQGRPPKLEALPPSTRAPGTKLAPLKLAITSASLEDDAVARAAVNIAALVYIGPVPTRACAADGNAQQQRRPNFVVTGDAKRAAADRA